MAVLSVGRGPGIVLLHGAMEWAGSHLELAEALGDRWAVHLPDRRDRRDAAPAVPGRDLEQGAADACALVAESGARVLVGVSSGAILCLETALALGDRIDAVVAFEPPLFGDPAVPQRFADQAAAELARGDVTQALVTGWLAVQLGPAWVRRLPRRLLETMVAAGSGREARTAVDPSTTMRALARSLPHEFRLVAAASGALDGDPDRYRALAAPVLLLGGDRSPAYLRQALDRLEALLPNASRVTLHGAGHEALGNAAQRGRPVEAAEVIAGFLDRVRT